MQELQTHLSITFVAQIPTKAGLRLRCHQAQPECCQVVLCYSSHNKSLPEALSVLSLYVKVGDIMCAKQFTSLEI